MRSSFFLGTVSALGLAGAAGADVPSVATDIPPVHSLVSIVMGDLGSPDLLVQPGASPHGYSLRPSEARALDQADAVFWIGEALVPWMAGSIEALASDARVVELIETDGTTELAFREGVTFEAHDHDHEEHAEHDDHNHDDHDHEEHAEHDDHDHDDHDHDDHAEHDDHDHEDHDHEDHAEHEDHDHDHHGNDPHAWLDPENGKVWLDVIAAELSALDPENAGTYAANAEAGKAELEALIGEITATLAPLRSENFVVFHDAYQYFETRFDIPAAGSITLADASDPSPARIEEIQGKVAELGVTCAFSEPQYDANLIATVFRGTDARTGVMDPLGTELTPGPDLYPQVLRNLATSLSDCLE
ncbi:zinc ABC transporter substrate-binding protein [Salipiger bermudensis]|uniref:zinc ABC transporter substrate-binding protein n=1 Tax=Salipiger bermudensis TaxID=344736 RepID=UPI0021BD8CB1|nr:zinc ABC transporter substrate-binding protein [Salipiger bermudensis]